MNGFSESAPPNVELAQELIRELRLLKKPMEGLAMDNLPKLKRVKSANVLVSNLFCNSITKAVFILQIANEYICLKVIYFLKFII